MKKLLTLVTILSFSTVEAGVLGNLANAALQGVATYNNYNNGYGNMNPYGTNYNMGTMGTYNTGMNNAGYNTGVAGTSTNTANSAVISSILTSMYQQAAMIQNTYKTNANIVTYTSNLGNVLTSCQQYPNQVLNQLPTILQYVVGIYSILNQYNGGANIKNLANGFSQLLFACLGLTTS